MKKFFFILALFAMTSGLYSQHIQKGALLGLHTGELVLNPGITMDQYISFLKEKYVPDIEKCFPGMKLFVMKGIRGECKDCISFLYFFQTVADRDKYFLPEGQMNEAGKAAMAKMDKKIAEEEKKYVKTSTDKYIDWLVQ